MPASCEQCGKVDLLEENIDVWEFAATFPGVITPAGLSGALRVDYGAVMELARATGIADIAGLLKRLEAIVRGYSGGRQQTANRHRR